MKYLIHPAVESERLEALRNVAPLATWVNAEDPEQASAAIIDASAFLGKIRPEMLARAEKLKWVQSFTASLEHYIFPGLVEHPCVLTNMKGLFGDVIADQVMGYIIAFARNLHLYMRHQLEKRYEPIGGESARVSFAAGPGTINAMDRATIFLPATTLGIVGLGAIGSEIARRAMAFGMKVRAVDRYPDRTEKPAGIGQVEGLEGLSELLGASDFVVIAAPQTPETERLFNAEILGKMKPNAYLVNIGRGAIVVLDDLVSALERKAIAGAALDVFEIEPLPSDHPLWNFPNVIITPHTAGYSTAIAERHLETLKENIRRFEHGEPLLNVVNKALWF